MLDISTKKNDNCLIVRLRGEFDMHSAPIFKKKIETAMKDQRANNLVIDFKGINFVDSSGLGAILGRYREIEKKGGKILLLNLRPPVKKIFTLAGLLGIMQEFDSEEKAIEILN